MIKATDLRIGMDIEEIWKPISGYEDYLISNCGRIKTLSRPLRYVHSVTKNEHFRKSTERHLKVYKTVWGYNFVNLRKNKKQCNFTIHRLVALTFLVNPNNYRDVNHIDGNKLNNRVDNLEWCTDEYNHQHATMHGLKARGSEIGSAKLNEKCIGAIHKLLLKGWRYDEIANLFDISRATISLIAEGKTWKHVVCDEVKLIVTNPETE